MFKYVVGLAFLAVVYAQRKAVVTLSSGDAKGTIYFTEADDVITITGTVSGLKEGKHGFHVHAIGDISDGCGSTGGHFNPHNVSHGAPNATTRHVGDLGNIEANSAGIATINFNDSIISLSGEHNIIGRGVVVHEGVDDLGLGGDEGSITTGNAGARVGCGVIGTLSDGRRLLSSLLPSTMIGLAILHRLL